MKNYKALIGVLLLWVLAEFSSWAFGQWLTVNVTDGEIAKLKTGLHFVVLHMSGQFGVGVLAGVALISIINGSVLPNFVRSVRGFLGGAKEESKTDPVSPVTNYYLGGGGAKAPGGGGGGGGALGDNSVAGSGGNGGHQLFSIITPEVVSALHSGELTMEVEVGEGGVSGKYPGENGKDGGASGIRFTSKDGKISNFFGVPGGKGGRAGFVCPPGAIDLGEDDIASGFRSTTLMLAEALHVKNGLMYVLGGAINSYTVTSLPSDISVLMINIFAVGELSSSASRLLCYAIDDPNGVEVAFGSIEFPVSESSRSLSFYDWRSVEFVVSTLGVWSIKVWSGNYELSRLSFEIRCESCTASD